MDVFEAERQNLKRCAAIRQDALEAETMGHRDRRGQNAARQHRGRPIDRDILPVKPLNQSRWRRCISSMMGSEGPDGKRPAHMRLTIAKFLEFECRKPKPATETDTPAARLAALGIAVVSRRYSDACRGAMAGYWERTGPA